MQIVILLMVLTMMMTIVTTLMTNEGMWWHKSSVRVNSDTHDINCFSKNEDNADNVNYDDNNDDADDARGQMAFLMLAQALANAAADNNPTT